MIVKKHYTQTKHCECGKLITNKSKRCRSCAMKLYLKKHSSKGVNNPNYIDGRALKQYYCKCGHKIHYTTWLCGFKRCKKCTAKKHLLNCQCCFCKAKRGEYLNKKRPEQSKQQKGINNSFYGRHHTEISKKKISLSHGGTGIPYEKGKYPIEWTSELKETIRKRDNYTCQNCGMTEEKHYSGDKQIKLHIHHIDYTKMNCINTNLIALCTSCHKKSNSNRDYWHAYFSYIMEDLKMNNLDIKTINISEKSKYSNAWKSGAEGQSRTAWYFFNYLKVKLNKNLKILEIGSGDGTTVSRLRQEGFINTFGLDITLSGLNSTNAMIKFDLPVEFKPILPINKSNYIESPIWNMPFADNSFDFVFSVDVLEHLPPELVEQSIKEIYRIASIETIHCIAAFFDNRAGFKFHLTVEPIDWWKEQFNKFNDKKIHTELLDRTEFLRTVNPNYKGR